MRLRNAAFHFTISASVALRTEIVGRVKADTVLAPAPGTVRILSRPELSAFCPFLSSPRTFLKPAPARFMRACFLLERRLGSANGFLVTGRILCERFQIAVEQSNPGTEMCEEPWSVKGYRRDECDASSRDVNHSLRFFHPGNSREPCGAAAVRLSQNDLRVASATRACRTCAPRRLLCSAPHGTPGQRPGSP